MELGFEKKSDLSFKNVFHLQGQPPRLDLPPEESTDLEELEQFAKMFKQKRIKLGTGFLQNTMVQYSYYYLTLQATLKEM